LDDVALYDVLRGSFTPQAYVDVWYGDDPLAQGLQVVDGSIRYTLDADVQAEITLTVADEVGDLRPSSPTAPLAPYGQEFQVSMGAAGSRMVIDPVQIGWFRIQESVSQDRWNRRRNGALRFGGASVVCTGMDRMSYLVDYRILSPTQPLVGGTVATEVTRLVDDLVPLGDFDATLLTGTAVSRTVIYDEDRVAALQGLAGSIGGTLRMSSDGLLVMVAPTAYGATPVWEFTVGDGGDIVSYQTSVTRDGVINAVLASGEADTDKAPVQAIAYDTDPASPTYYGGPFGKVPLAYSSPLITTTTQAQKAATTRLNGYRRGREREITVSIPPNFLIELDDPVRLNLPDMTLDGRVVAMELPLTPKDMSLTVRALDSSFVTLDGA
jgi:hypothetical protein